MKTITIQVPDGCDIQIVREKENKEPVIRTYQDLIDNSIKIDSAYWITDTSIIHKSKSFVIDSEEDKSIAASEKVAKSMLAMAMISQLMPYYGGAITDEEWRTYNTKYIIERYEDKIRTNEYSYSYNFLAFHTSKQRAEFLEYNKQLVKDYLMIE